MKGYLQTFQTRRSIRRGIPDRAAWLACWRNMKQRRAKWQDRGWLNDHRLAPNFISSTRMVVALLDGLMLVACRVFF